MVLHQGYYLTSICSCIKCYCPKVRSPDSWGSKTVPFEGTRNDIIWKISFTHKKFQDFNDLQDLFE